MFLRLCHLKLLLVLQTESGLNIRIFDTSPEFISAAAAAAAGLVAASFDFILFWTKLLIFRAKTAELILLLTCVVFLPVVMVILQSELHLRYFNVHKSLMNSDRS